MADVSVLEVLLHGEPIGTLTNVGGDRTLFAFTESYTKSWARPTLSLGFKDQFGELITDHRPTQTKLMPFFSNLLPEAQLRTYLADLVGVNPEREFFLLWALGADLPGSVTIRPIQGQSWLPIPNSKNADSDTYQENALRFSLAGVQLKFSAIQEASGGLTIPATGSGGSWILKFPDQRFAGVPENEFSMMVLARMIGMDIPFVDLIDVAEIGNLPPNIDQITGQALAIERFDRLSDGTTVHIEDFAQIFRVYPGDKYKKANYRNIATVIGAEGTTADIVEFIRRLTFNTLIGNADMHLKNWSLIYPDRRTAALAPGYDFVSTIAFLKDTGAALNFSRTRRFSQFSEDELAHLASGAMLPRKLVLDTAKETTDLFLQIWSGEKSHLPLSKATIKAIDAHIKTIPLATPNTTPRP